MRGGCCAPRQHIRRFLIFRGECGLRIEMRITGLLLKILVLTEQEQRIDIQRDAG